MNVAILCNNTSNNPSARKELILSLHEKFENVYNGGILADTIDPYFNEKTAIFIPIKASRDNTNPIHEIESILSIKKQIKKHNIDSVIIYGVKNHASMSIGAKLGGAKNILCVVNGSGNLFLLPGVKGRILRMIAFPMLRFGYSKSKSICFQNSDDRQLFLEKKLIKNTNKTFVTGGSGTNLSVFTQQPMPKERRFLFLARITPTKGITQYIEAAYTVKKKYPDSVFDIVGPLDLSVESGKINDIISKAKEDGIIKYHGATDDVPGWLQKCRYFIYPSYYPEGVPRCSIQAAATGRPIITCDVPGCRDTVSEGYNGFLVSARNSEQLAEKMIWMIEHEHESEVMGANSRVLAEHKFDVYEINQQVIFNLTR